VTDYSRDSKSVTASALFTVDANDVPARVSVTNPVPTTTSAPVAADIVNGFQTFAATTGATTLLTVAAGRTWVGSIGAACAVGIAAASTTAGQARAVFATAGTGVTPAAGTVLAIEAKAGANAATGVTGSQGSSAGSTPLTVIAPSGNAVTVTVATTQAGTASVVDAWASGRYVA